MSESKNMPAAELPSSFAMVRTVAAVALLSAVLIVLVVNVTEARIEYNKRTALENAVFSVLPGAVSRKTFEVADEGFIATAAPAPGVDRIYAGYDAEGNLVGLAIEAAGQGYQDVVRVLFGYSPAEQQIIGFQVLGSKETPGLGDRIGKDSEFLANFEKLDVHLDDEGVSLAHPIVFVKHGTKQNPWEIDGITGATISSRAVANMLNARCQAIVPFIRRHLEQLKEAQ